MVFVEVRLIVTVGVTVGTRHVEEADDMVETGNIDTEVEEFSLLPNEGVNK